ncbi:hypothetical protein THII_0046 [Thioploca ingrica]|uniref:DUF29 domain-containing protein n=1 Tax=Thioploca ingrica TaxID=40754 RepID=A0A090AA92_9GAMM|nr:hypothetical protein THII_0046 [Thioploca ingrica]
MENWTEVYEKDYYTWVARHVELLKKGSFSEIDIEHLIEELEGMARSDKRELESRLIILIAHLLKWPFQLQYLKEQWRGFEGQSGQSTIIEQRTQLESLLDKIPNLKNLFPQMIDQSYPYALKLATKAGRVGNASLLPTLPGCPFSLEPVMSEEFWPE